jgi:hypothetical protein
MGTYYTQHAIYGVEINSEEFKRTASPAEYREEPRFDTKTGLQTHVERILVKREVVEYQYGDISSDCEYDFIEKLINEYSGALDTIWVHGGNLFVGRRIGEKGNGWCVNLIDTSVKLNEIEKIHLELIKLFKSQDLALHLIGEAS